MRHLLRNSIFSIGLLILALWAVSGEGALRLGKDLRGGTTLVYSVSGAAGRDADEVIGQTISVLKERVDPTGALELQIVAQGNDRIEVTMPLPTDETRALRAAFEAELTELAALAIDAAAVERAMRSEGEARAAAIADLARGNEAIASALEEAAARYDRAQRLRAEYGRLLEQDGGEASDRARELERAIAQAEIAYEDAREAALRSGLDPQRLRRALELSDAPRFLRDASVPDSAADERKFVERPSPREAALQRLRDAHPELAEQIDAVVAAFEVYEANRVGLEDTEELKRLLQAAGVPAFRITVDPQGTGEGNEHPEEARLRAELRENGPRNVRSRDTVWGRINNIDNWYDSVQQLEFLEADPAGYFASRYGLVAEPYAGSYYVLLWDTRGKRLTQAEGSWSVARAYETIDELGRPAIGFEMDARGAARLGELTSQNVQNNMAVLLDGEVYTAPNLRGAISRRGVIEGGSDGFSRAEIDYIVKVLTAGSLQARLSPEPLSETTIAPEFGLDNLEAGRTAGLIALVVVSVFMIFYYFAYGVVAVLSLLFNAVLILAAMALARQPFTLPGIAGIILTFGMAVDANVLIYERIREEMRGGEKLKAAVRLGYKKALSSIVDGNVTNLIVCFVLANPALGTQEIRGFAITLGIGVVCTLFTALFVSRLLLAIFTEGLKVKRMPMLPTVAPALERALEPKINWIGLRYVFVCVSAGYLLLGIGMIAFQGEEMLDTEFRGGTQVDIRLRPAEPGAPSASPDGNVMASRAEIEEPIRAIGGGLDPADPLAPLETAEVIPIDPVEGVISDRFRIKTYATQTEAVLDAIVEQLGGLLESRPALSFAGDAASFDDALDRYVFPILTNARGEVVLGDVIGRPGVRNDVRPFLGGVAIHLENLEPRPAIGSIRERIELLRGGREFSETLNHRLEFVITEGTPEAVESVAILAIAEGIGYLDGREAWEAELASPEWRLAQAALTTVSVPASVQSFSPVIAEGFQQQAIVSVAMSLGLILIYIWVRFGSVRYSLAAIATLTHDVLAAIGLIALAEILYKNEVTAGIAEPLGIQPFKIDLNLVAAILTIIGYSLNDTIIIMDRIRENRGRLPYASRDVINLSINQTISRTVITSGTTILATLILYSFGGAGVRAFAYALLVGVLIGTYSSVAVAAPLVWSRKRQSAFGRPEPAGPKGFPPSDDDPETPRLP